VTDPTIQIVALPPFTPTYPLSFDPASGLLEGTRFAPRQVHRQPPTVGNCAVRMGLIASMASTRAQVWGAPVLLSTSPQGSKTYDQPAQWVDVTWIRLQGLPVDESLVFAHPYADVKRLWGEYLLRQRGAP
jgi:hypothetical protein